MQKIRICFDGPPGPEAGRFVEVENEEHKSICFGEWVQEGDYWYLEFPDAQAALAEREIKLESMFEEGVRLAEVNGKLREQIAALARDNKNMASLNDSFPEEIIKLEQEIAALKARLKPIEECWDRYKHLDHLLSDKDWLDDSTPQRHALYDFWQAIRQAGKEEEG